MSPRTRTPLVAVRGVAYTADRLVEAANRLAGAEILWITEIKYFVKRGVIEPIGRTADGEVVFGRAALHRLLAIARKRIAYGDHEALLCDGEPED